MWARAREELLRPGLSGGGGGKPLLDGTGLTGVAAVGGGANDTVFLGTIAGTGLDLTDLITVWGTGLATDLDAGMTGCLATGLAADCAPDLDTGLADALASGLAAAFTRSLDFVFTAAFGKAFALTGDALAPDLCIGFFTGILARAAVLAAFLTSGLAATLGMALALACNFGFTAALTAAFTFAFAGAFLAVFAAGLALALTTALAAPAFAGLPVLAAFPPAAAGLPPAWTAADIFSDFACTACLLWDAASEWAPPPSPDRVAGRVFWSARDCSGWAD